MKLYKWGWSPERGEAVKEYVHSGLFPARVLSVGNGIYRIVDGNGEEQRAEVSGGFRYRTVSETDFPCVGDFVLCHGEGGICLIERVLERKGVLKRKAAGRGSEEQLIASNIDLVFLVFALDGSRNYNTRGLERLLTLAWDSGASPVVILNKCDLCDDIASAIRDAGLNAPEVPVAAVSALEGTGMEQIPGLFPRGRTAVLIGRSGVGKSALVNALQNEEIMKTGAVREDDKRGRHTTTHRELFLLPHGGLIIDSPGIRAVTLTGSEEALLDTFDEIAGYAEKCKFSDCTHTGEPDCAVQYALNEGLLDYDRYCAYLEQRRELRYQASRLDARLRAQEEQKWKNIAKWTRELKKKGDRF